ncbi:hypothetical protein, partial [Klebsiella pneumoniae]|uniref:hypothetical protein n=1 Tax=Klebsiella pneumoniae TaxID=573 RepID=UPI0027316FBA
EPGRALLLLRKIHARSFLQLQITVNDFFKAMRPGGRPASSLTSPPVSGRARILDPAGLNDAPPNTRSQLAL